MRYVIIILLTFICSGCFTHQHLSKKHFEETHYNSELKFAPDNFRIIYRKGIYREQSNLIVDKTEVIIGSNNFGEIKFSPCGSSIGFDLSCEENLFITETDLITIYNTFIRLELSETQWQTCEFIYDGDVYEEAIFELNGFEFVVPPFLEFDQITADQVFTSIRSIIPDGTWLNIKREKENYYKQNRIRTRY